MSAASFSHPIAALASAASPGGGIVVLHAADQFLERSGLGSASCFALSRSLGEVGLGFSERRPGAASIEGREALAVRDLVPRDPPPDVHASCARWRSRRGFARDRRGPPTRASDFRPHARAGPRRAASKSLWLSARRPARRGGRVAACVPSVGARPAPRRRSARRPVERAFGRVLPCWARLDRAALFAHRRPWRSRRLADRLRAVSMRAAASLAWSDLEAARSPPSSAPCVSRRRRVDGLAGAREARIASGRAASGRLGRAPVAAGGGASSALAECTIVARNGRAKVEAEHALSYGRPHSRLRSPLVTRDDRDGP